ncbi:ESPR-type extended signal peptide-containing protein [Escherichia coli]
MNRIYRVIWNCTLQVFQACSELTRRAGKTSTVNLRKSSGLTTKFSRSYAGCFAGTKRFSVWCKSGS